MCEYRNKRGRTSMNFRWVTVPWFGEIEKKSARGKKRKRRERLFKSMVLDGPRFHGFEQWRNSRKEKVEKIEKETQSRARTVFFKSSSRYFSNGRRFHGFEEWRKIR